MADPGFFCHFPHPAWPGSTKVQRILGVHKIVIVGVVVVQDSSPALVPGFDPRGAAESPSEHVLPKLSPKEVFELVVGEPGALGSRGSSRGPSASPASPSSPAAASSSAAASSTSAPSSPSAPPAPPSPPAPPARPSALPIPFARREFPFDFPLGFFGLHNFAVVVVAVDVILVCSGGWFRVGIRAASAFGAGAGSWLPAFWWRQTRLFL